VDATGFLKSGPKSAGVARPSAGPAGKIDHGQSGVFLAYASLTGRTGLDRERLCLKSQKNELKIDCFRRKKVNKASAKPTFEAKPLLAHPFS
jgi:SRSO17 transposase